MMPELASSSPEARAERASLGTELSAGRATGVGRVRNSAIRMHAADDRMRAFSDRLSRSRARARAARRAATPAPRRAVRGRARATSPPTASATPPKRHQRAWRRAATRLPQPVIEALQDGRLLFSADKKRVFIQDEAGETDRRRDRPAVCRRRARRPRHRAPQQSAARGRRSARSARSTLIGARSRQALRGGAGGVQVARRRRAAGARPGDRRAKPTRASSRR